MAIRIVLLAVFFVLRPTQTCACLGFPLLNITVSTCLPARQGPSPRTPSGAHHVQRHSDAAGAANAWGVSVDISTTEEEDSENFSNYLWLFRTRMPMLRRQDLL